MVNRVELAVIVSVATGTPSSPESFHSAREHRRCTLRRTFVSRAILGREPRTLRQFFQELASP